MKRFYKKADIAEIENAYVIQLDGRPIKTKTKVTLKVPTASLAELIATEWDVQGDEVDPLTMPMMTLASTTIDRVMPDKVEISDMLSEYGGNDLLCYRAEDTQAELLKKQHKNWQPWLDWAMRELDAPLKTTSGIIHIPQEETSIVAMSKVVHATTAHELTALHEFTTMSGSLVLGIAVLREELAAEEALKLGLLDELHQAELWGEDYEAQDRRDKLIKDMQDAETFLKAVRA